MNDEIGSARSSAEKILSNVEKVIVGKREVAELAVIALMSQGHLLIEDAPGVGKTMLARSLARSINGTFRRIQFTPDMLPGDIIGVSIYNLKTNDFEFRPGPIMGQIVLADEINRATPKVQSALLECMEERQITVDGISYEVPSPFHIIATQNPLEYDGTFPLPETQLDRFLMRISMGYPSPADEVTIMDKQQYTHPIAELKEVTGVAEFAALQETVRKVYVDNLVKQYIAAIMAATRVHPDIYLGASPRGSLALYRAAQARALMLERGYVLPDDIKALAVAVLAHRLILRVPDRSRYQDTRKYVTEIIETIPVPGTVPNGV
jgi:MoxR-like ATPase